MLDFEQYTYQYILNSMLNRVPDKYDKREGSIIQTALGPAAYELESVFLELDKIQKSAFIETAVGDALDLLGIIAGLQRYPASPAVRLGVFSQPVPLGARFSTINGNNSINFTVTAVTGQKNQFQLTAEMVGVIGNSYTGQILPITYLPGLENAEITDILVPGEETETDDDFRERIITALNEKPFGGNVAAYRQFIGGLTGVGGVQVYPTWNGGGTVRCSIIGADYMPASETLLKSVQDAVDPPPQQGLGLGMAPIGAQVTISTPKTAAINVSAKLTLATGYEIGQIQKPIETAIGEYLLGIRKKWDDPIEKGGVVYRVAVYVAQIIASMIAVQGVINATDVKLNGVARDIFLNETGVSQEIPILGTVTLSV